ncbi:PaaI family thioesterase [Dyadobacter sp. CY323]|uniref:PaaI family thioesterase n=1 Tax=Dyadobacter sp. CY323 TaxID=2907302 RepID=UPI001F1EE710|nr:PaaI family thioesterase [Dyadobacter sp. CY323]MCE6988324.1 PaaI family thioesterase [Dyadobacter sp. CY323]
MSNVSNAASDGENKRLAFMQELIGQRMSQSVSPVGRWLNGKLLDIQEASMEVEYTVREDMTNPMKALHGGIAATILDDIVGTLVYAMGREFAFVSVNLNCDFLHAAKLGDIIFAKAQVVRAGKNIIHVEGQIHDFEGKIIAKCTSNLIQSSFKIPS